MARRSLTLVQAEKLASKVVKDDDSHVDELIELFARTAAKGNAKEEAIRKAVLRRWYSETEHFRASFREYMEQFEDSEEEGEGEQEIEADAIDTNALVS